MLLKIETKNQIIRCTNSRFVVADSVNFTQVKFNFDREWAGYTVTATFTNLKTKVSKSILLDKGSMCFIPHEVLAYGGELNIYLEGVKDDSVATTAVMKYPLEIKPSGKVDAEETSEPTPDVYQQIIEQLNKLQDDKALAGRVEQAVKDYLEEHPVAPGIGIQSISINEENHLIVTMTDNTVIDAGVLPKGEPGSDGNPGQNGKDGFSPQISVKSDTDKEYILNIMNSDGTFSTPNLKGKNGLDGEVTDLLEQSLAFTEAEADANIASGDSLKVMFGKLLKTIKTFRTKHASIDSSIMGIESALSEHAATLSRPTPISRGGTGETVRYESVTLTRNTANTPAASTASCRYYPFLQMCLARLYIATRNTLTYKAGEMYTLYTVPEGYRPTAAYAGTCYFGGSASGKVRINSSGEIALIPNEDITTGWLIYITIFWFK